MSVRARRRIRRRVFYRRRPPCSNTICIIWCHRSRTWAVYRPGWAFRDTRRYHIRHHTPESLRVPSRTRRRIVGREFVVRVDPVVRWIPTNKVAVMIRRTTRRRRWRRKNRTLMIRRHQHYHPPVCRWRRHTRNRTSYRWARCSIVIRTSRRPVRHMGRHTWRPPSTLPAARSIYRIRLPYPYIMLRSIIPAILRYSRPTMECRIRP